MIKRRCSRVKITQLGIRKLQTDGNSISPDLSVVDENLDYKVNKTINELWAYVQTFSRKPIFYHNYV